MAASPRCTYRQSAGSYAEEMTVTMEDLSPHEPCHYRFTVTSNGTTRSTDDAMFPWPKLVFGPLALRKPVASTHIDELRMISVATIHSIWDFPLSRRTLTQHHTADVNEQCAQ